jgi:hypothetical protein
VRYALLAYLGSLYGHRILRFLAHYYQPLLYLLIGLAVVGGLVALYYWLRYKRRGKDRPSARPVQKPA